MIFYIIKKLIYTLCLIYTVNIFIIKKGKMIPINFYTIIYIYLFDFLAVLSIIYIKYYC